MGEENILKHFRDQCIEKLKNIESNTYQGK